MIYYYFQLINFYDDWITKDKRKVYRRGPTISQPFNVTLHWQCYYMHCCDWKMTTLVNVTCHVDAMTMSLCSGGVWQACKNTLGSHSKIRHEIWLPRHHQISLGRHFNVSCSWQHLIPITLYVWPFFGEGYWSPRWAKWIYLSVLKVKGQEEDIKTKNQPSKNEPLVFYEHLFDNMADSPRSLHATGLLKFIVMEISS